MRVRALRSMAAAAFATSSLVLACNLDAESFISPGFVGGASGGSFDTGTPQERRDRCEVHEGDTCISSAELASCEVKEHANPACNESLTCDFYEWRRLPSEHRECASECPSQYVAELPDGCAMPHADTLICEYPEGTCGCAPVRPLDPDAGDGGESEGGSEVPDTDAGDPDAGDADIVPTVYEWKCITPEAGCPRTRPTIGSDCVRPMSCDYGDCLFEDGATMRCYSGRWILDARCSRRR